MITFYYVTFISIFVLAVLFGLSMYAINKYLYGDKK